MLLNALVLEPLKNVMSTARTRQKLTKRRSLRGLMNILNDNIVRTDFFA